MQTIFDDDTPAAAGIADKRYEVRPGQLVLVGCDTRVHEWGGRGMTICRMGQRFTGGPVRPAKAKKATCKRCEDGKREAVGAADTP